MSDTKKPSELESVSVDPKKAGLEDEFIIFHTTQWHWMDFVVLYVISEDDDGAFFPLGGWEDSSEVTDDPDKAEVFVRGYLKWDGCMEVEIGDKHFCGLHHSQILQRIFERLHAIAAEKMKSYDKGLAD